MLHGGIPQYCMLLYSVYVLQGYAHEKARVRVRKACAGPWAGNDHSHGADAEWGGMLT